MNVGDPNSMAVPPWLRESEMLIVVKIPGKVKAGVAKEHYCKSSFFNNKLKDRIDV